MHETSRGNPHDGQPPTPGPSRTYERSEQDETTRLAPRPDSLGACLSRLRSQAPVLQSTPIPDVAGAWTGTVKTLEASGDDGPLCPPEPVSVDIERTSGPNGRIFHASIRSDCVTANFNGEFVAPANKTLNGTVTYEVAGITYQAVLKRRARRRLEHANVRDDVAVRAPLPRRERTLARQPAARALPLSSSRAAMA
jgi:hypothetical protein